MKKLLLTIALVLPMTVLAQEFKDATVSIPQTVKTIRMAAELSKNGYANNDALSLIHAARLSKQLGLTLEEKEKTQEGEAIVEEGQKNGQVSLDAVKLLADAKVLAGDDGVLLALIDDVNSNVRGAVGGPKYALSRVGAGGTDVYHISFRTGEPAIVTISGDGDTDLDLYIFDNDGNLVDSDTDYSDDCVCAWTPIWTGQFTIRIRNRGRVYNSYVIHTN